MPYTLRPTSLVGEKLDNELRRVGAHTSGSQKRKQERLQRFLETAKPDITVVLQGTTRTVLRR